MISIDSCTNKLADNFNNMEDLNQFKVTLDNLLDATRIIYSLHSLFEADELSDAEYDVYKSEATRFYCSVEDARDYLCDGRYLEGAAQYDNEIYTDGMEYMSDGKYADKQYDAPLTDLYNFMASNKCTWLVRKLEYWHWDERKGENVEELWFAGSTFLALFRRRREMRELRDTEEKHMQEICKSVADDPMSLIVLDDDGLSLLERERSGWGCGGVGEAEARVVAFLEEKTSTALAVRNAFGDMSSEDFKERFEMWEQV